MSIDTGSSHDNNIMVNVHSYTFLQYSIRKVSTKSREYVICVSCYITNRKDKKHPEAMARTDRYIDDTYTSADGAKSTFTPYSHLANVSKLELDHQSYFIYTHCDKFK